MVASGRSILDLTMLGASVDTRICVQTTGTQAKECLHALEELISDGFGEREL